ncbi:hypothetical protein PHAVU_002G236200 [Phaseolus vulgaris]
MERDSGSGTNGKGYAWAVSAGFNAALAAISVKLPLHQFLRYGMVLLFNVTMWASYVNSLKALSSLQATVTNFATNFISSGLAGFLFFRESLSFQQYSGRNKCFGLPLKSMEPSHTPFLNYSLWLELGSQTFFHQPLLGTWNCFWIKN